MSDTPPPPLPKKQDSTENTSKRICIPRESGFHREHFQEILNSKRIRIPQRTLPRESEFQENQDSTASTSNRIRIPQITLPSESEFPENQNSRVHFKENLNSKIIRIPQRTLPRESEFQENQDSIDNTSKRIRIPQRTLPREPESGSLWTQRVQFGLLSLFPLSVKNNW